MTEAEPVKTQRGMDSCGCFPHCNDNSKYASTYKRIRALQEQQKSSIRHTSGVPSFFEDQDQVEVPTYAQTLCWFPVREFDINISMAYDYRFLARSIRHYHSVVFSPSSEVARIRRSLHQGVQSIDVQQIFLRDTSQTD